MKTRTIFTVTRTQDGPTDLESFKASCDAIQDEKGEYLYGGHACHETIAVAFQVSEDGETWMDFYPHLKPCFVQMTYATKDAARPPYHPHELGD